MCTPSTAVSCRCCFSSDKSSRDDPGEQRWPLTLPQCISPGTKMLLAFALSLLLPQVLPKNRRQQTTGRDRCSATKVGKCRSLEMQSQARSRWRMLIKHTGFGGWELAGEGAEPSFTLLRVESCQGTPHLPGTCTKPGFGRGRADPSWMCLSVKPRSLPLPPAPSGSPPSSAGLQEALD